MRHTINLHLDGEPQLAVGANNGTTWLELRDGEKRDHVTVFASDIDPARLRAAAAAFNAAIAAPADEHKEAAE